MRYFFVVNPNAGGGRCGKIFEKTIRPYIKRRNLKAEVVFTKGSGDATQYVKEAKEGGTEWNCVVSVGGDGTHNEVLNGVHPLTEDPPFEMAFLTIGTGGDLRKTLGMPANPLRQLDCILRIPPVLWDVGKVIFTDEKGEEKERLFINMTSFGISGLVVRKVNRSEKKWGGTIPFLLSTFSSLFEYRSEKVTIRYGSNKVEIPLFLGVVANGKWFGGGMKIAPMANPRDGVLDLLWIPDQPLWRIFRHFPRVYRGTHIDPRFVHHAKVEEVEILSSAPVPLDLDGESPGYLPARFSILREAIRIRGWKEGKA
jgi:YegS/Rv2252/BmrU family lipid kinase